MTTPPPILTAATAGTPAQQQESLSQGLRILARMIARAHLRDTRPPDDHLAAPESPVGAP